MILVNHVGGLIWLIFSAVGSVLYLFGGTNYPESEECLEGLYAYDIGKICILVIRKPDWYLILN